MPLRKTYPARPADRLAAPSAAVRSFPASSLPRTSPIVSIGMMNSRITLIVLQETAADHPRHVHRPRPKLLRLHLGHQRHLHHLDRIDRKKIPDRKTKMVRTTYAIGELKVRPQVRVRQWRVCFALSELASALFCLLGGSQFQENVFETHRCGLQFEQSPAILHDRARQIASDVFSKFAFDLKSVRPSMSSSDFERRPRPAWL